MINFIIICSTKLCLNPFKVQKAKTYFVFVFILGISFKM